MGGTECCTNAPGLGNGADTTGAVKFARARKLGAAPS